MTTNYISLATEAKLALESAEQRLIKAQRNLQDFLIEHQDETPSPELAQSFAREEDLLTTEADEAQRFFTKCATDLKELEGASGLEK
jgi:hypothetical protein